MPFEPLRFAHAANLFLDTPLALSAELDELPDAVQRQIEGATLAAFANLIDHCLERDVDFLLLGGNTFIEADYSLPARIALRNGWNQLREAGIRLYVLPGEFDPPDAWARIPEIADCVTVLNHADSEPLAVLRNGKLIAAIAAADLRTEPDDAPQREPGGPFRIGLCPLDGDGHPAEPNAIMPVHSRTAFSPFQTPVRPNTTRLSRILETNRFDYLAVAGVTNRLLLRSDSGLIHHPGAPQNLNAGATEAGGCTLVEVAARDDVRCTNLPTAAVRFQTIKLPAHEESTPKERLAAMRDQLEHLKPCANERVRIVEWKLRGRGLDLVNDVPELPREINAAIPVALVHNFASRIASPANEPGEDNEERDSLTEEFRRELHEFVEAGGFDPHESISAIDGLSTTAADRLHAIVDEETAASLRRRAERKGIERLQPAAD